MQLGIQLQEPLWLCLLGALVDVCGSLLDAGGFCDHGMWLQVLVAVGKTTAAGKGNMCGAGGQLASLHWVAGISRVPACWCLVSASR